MEMSQSCHIPVLCCGCPRLGTALNKLSKTLSFSSEYPSYSNGDSGDWLNGILSSDSNSSTQLETMTNALTNMLESTSGMRSIAILNELGIGNRFPPHVLSHVKDNFPELTIVSVLIAPAGGISGLASIGSIISAQAALEYSDYVMIREIDEARSYMSSEYSGGTCVALQQIPTYNIEEVYQCIASDVFVTLSSTWGPKEDIADNCLWPFNVCTSRKKIFDVRSSLWRSMRRTSKSKTIFNPMRAVSTSVHSLHLWYTLSDSFGMSINSANVIDFRIDPCIKCLVTSHSTIPISDVASALRSSTPKVSWPQLFGSRSYLDSSLGHISSTLKISGHAAISSLDSSAGKVLGANSSKDNQFAVSFESPYAKKALEKVCSDVSGLLHIGAYSHR